MKIIKVTNNESGQRMDKLLFKYMNLAPKSFMYKMLRKKNITLNGHKATGSEILQLEDEIRMFLSDETIDKFSELNIQKTKHNLDIIYEDKHILIINKPVGMLSQKAEDSDVSLVEHVISYLIDSKQITMEELKSFKPSICNRLDRNTSGIVVAGKTLYALQTMAEIFKNRTIHKYYQCIVKGRLEKKQLIEGFLIKDEQTNKVSIAKEEMKGSSYIRTEYEPLQVGQHYTLLKVRLITGRSHQIRAHLASVNHPIIGDFKYGDKTMNQYFKKKYQLEHQLLHSYQIVFPEFVGELSYLTGKTYMAELPKQFKQIQKENI